MSKTALVTGASGFLGRQVFKAFQSAGFQTVGTGFSRASPPSIRKIDLTNEAAITSLIDDLKPDVVIHCAANRFPDKVDQDPEGASRINVQATNFLVRACARHSSFLIYISTDYVFPGPPGEAPYESTATPRPTNLYGQTKLDGEQAIQSALTEGVQVKVAILRVPVLYGPASSPDESAVNTRKFACNLCPERVDNESQELKPPIVLNAIWKGQEKGASVDMDHWAKRYPTNTEDVARVCVDLSKKVLLDQVEDDMRGAIFHFSSEDCFTKYEMCEIFAEILGLPLRGINAKSEGNDPNARVQRPYDTHLSTKALKELEVAVYTQDFKAFWRRELGAYRK